LVSTLRYGLLDDVQLVANEFKHELDEHSDDGGAGG
jgi:hypothetical protein